MRSADRLFELQNQLPLPHGTPSAVPKRQRTGRGCFGEADIFFAIRIVRRRADNLNRLRQLSLKSGLYSKVLKVLGGPS